ncbi:hybrid sensor histidine kinase/response regulator [Leptospira sp. GIMC2001]|uniref:hybrid sensor histidine kinase/response regulator n=1 Tax=Leptospira sp. GIMC2001 TaxID=1513297 RepID=UPI00234AFCFC|nr:ATP-binding protein [Leptospira sp. GIMC2001]WCL49273.1 response regulator [Leptospira sp. GIMC2001]
MNIPSNWSGDAINLSGEWLALPGIRNPEDFHDKKINPTRMQIPTIGKNTIQDPELHSMTFFLHVDIDSSNLNFDTLSILTSKVRTAHRIFVNGIPINQQGIVSETAENHVPKLKPMVSAFSYSNHFDIVIQISNYNFGKLGIIDAPKLGKSFIIYNLLYKNKLYDYALIFISIIFIFVNLGIYISNSKDKSSLIFASILFLFAILISVSSTTDRIFWDYYPDISYDFIVRLENSIFHIVPALFFLFLRSTFPNEMKRSYLLCYGIVKLILVIATFYSTQVFYKLIVPIIAFDFLMYSLSFVIILQAAKNRRHHAKLLLTGLVIVGITLALDILSSLGIIRTIRTTLEGFSIMFFIYSLILILRVRKTYIANESLNENLIEANEFLEHKIQERTGSLRETMQNLKDANQLKDRFISIVSHDIKSPLSGVYSLLSFILSDPDLSKTEILSHIKPTQKTLKGLIRMTEEILNYSKSQSNQIIPNFEKLSLNNIIEETIGRHRMLLDNKKIELQITGDDSIEIITDASLLGIAMSNFLSNAIKFSKEKGKIDIQFYEYTDSYELKIIDSGIGIQNIKLGTIFSYDHNISTLGTIGERGSGFGLPFSKEILDALQIGIEINSQVSEGTEVRLIFPKKEKILLTLDDNPNFRKFFHDQLAEILPEYLIIQKDSGEQALEQLKSLKVDLIFTDYQMPGMDGLDFSYRVRQMDAYKETKIFLITSYLETEENIFQELKSKASVFGIEHIFSKSLDPEYLKKIISDSVSNQ